MPRLVVGGTPTLPIHAELDLPGVECSPGTPVLYDNSYLTRYPDLPFTPAALLLTRVVSHPGPGRICLDLGYKAVASDPVGARARLLEPDDARMRGAQRRAHGRRNRPCRKHPDRDPSLRDSRRMSARPSLCTAAPTSLRTAELVGQWDVTARDRVLGDLIRPAGLGLAQIR